MAPKTLLNTPRTHQSPIRTNATLSTPGKHQRAHQQPPLCGKPISKSAISTAQLVRRRLIQKSVKLLNAPKHKSILSPYPETAPSTKPLSSIDTCTDIPQTEEGLETSQLKLPISRLPAKQVLLPQENPFEINSEFIPHQEKEVEAVFKAPEFDDFLLPPVLEDQINDSTLMHRHLPRQAGIDKIMDQINRKYLLKFQLPCSIRDMQVAYLTSPHFRDIYLSVGMNKIPMKSTAARKLESDLRNAIYI